MVSPLALLASGSAGAGAVSSIESLYPPLGRFIKHVANKTWANEILDPLTLLNLKRRGIITETEYKNELKNHGMGDTYSKLLDFSDDLLLNVSELLEKYRSKCMIKFSQVAAYLAQNSSLTETQINTKWAELTATKTSEFALFETDALKIGVQSTEANNIKTALRVRPSTQDVLLFMGREAFEQDIVDAIGLDDDRPRAFDEFCKILDMQPFEIKSYWVAHWNHVTPEQFATIRARFGSHRTDLTTADYTALGTTKADLQLSTDVETAYYNLIELAPYWGKRLELASKRSLPEIFLRWGYERGVLNSEQVRKVLLDKNYDPRVVPIMVKIIELKYSPEKDIDLANNTYERFKRSMITKATAKSTLVSAGYLETTVETQLQIIQDDKDIEVQDMKLKTIYNRFKNSITTESEMETALTDLIPSTTRVDLLKLEFIEAKSSIVKKLEKGDIIKALRNNAMTAADAKTRLVAIQYTSDDADILLSSLSGST